MFCGSKFSVVVARSKFVGSLGVPEGRLVMSASSLAGFTGFLFRRSEGLLCSEGGHPPRFCSLPDRGILRGDRRSELLPGCFRGGLVLVAVIVLFGVVKIPERFVPYDR